MNPIPTVLTTCQLFTGIAEDNLSALLTCLGAESRGFEKGEYILSADDESARVGVVTSGGVLVVQDDYWGNRTILSRIRPGGLFGESFACAEAERQPVSVVAAEKTEVLLIDLARIVTTCSSACAFHTALIQNILKILARSNLALVQKMEHITRRTTREKLLSFLSVQAAAAGNPSFDVPYSRQEMADYLAVDRSAMSAELSRLRDDGLLRYNRNHFELL
jgi:CRP-like cAMP-binding protein